MGKGKRNREVKKNRWRIEQDGEWLGSVRLENNIYQAYPPPEISRKPGKFKSFEESQEYLKLMCQVDVEPCPVRVRQVKFGARWNRRGVHGWNG